MHNVYIYVFKKQSSEVLYITITVLELKTTLPMNLCAICDWLVTGHSHLA